MSKREKSVPSDNPIRKFSIEEQWEAFHNNSTTDFFTFRRSYTKIMSKLTAVFFQDLTNIARSPKMRTKIIEGEIFFQCTEDFLINSEIGWSANEQEYHLRKLIKLGYMTKRRMGVPSRRWLHVCWEAVHHRLKKLREATETDNFGNQSHENPADCTTGNPADYLTRKKKQEKGGSVAASPPPVSSSPMRDRITGGSVVPEDGHSSAAKKLKESLFAGNIPPSGKSPKSSAEGFRLLSSVEQVDYTSILNEYCVHCRKGLAHLKKLKLPTAHDGIEFRQCYTWISDKLEKIRETEQDIADAAGRFSGSTWTEDGDRITVSRRGSHQ